MQIWPRSFDRIYNYVIIHYVKSIFYFISFFPIKNSENLNDKFIDLLSIRFVLLNCTPIIKNIYILQQLNKFRKSFSLLYHNFNRIFAARWDGRSMSTLYNERKSERKS